MRSHKLVLGLLFIFLMVLLPSISAFSFTSVEEFTKDETTSEYGKYQIYEKDLFLFKGDLIKDYQLEDNTLVCGGGVLCEANFDSTLTKDGTLVDKWNIYNKDTMNPDTMRWYRLEYYGDVKDYTSECSQAKLTEEELKNETKPYETCIQVESGSHKDWITFNEGQIFKAGNYKWRGIGDKAPLKNIEWTFETSDIETVQWATWGVAELRSGLISQWKMNDNTTTSKVIDAMGINNGTIVTDNSSNRAVTGKINGALFLEGGKRIDLGNSINFIPTDNANLSLAFWFNTKNISPNSIGNTLFRFQNATGTIFSVTLGDSNQLNYYNGVIASRKNFLGINTNTWYHIVITYNGTTFVPYLDGAVNTSLNLVAPLPAGANVNVSVGTTGTTSLPYNGSLDDIRIYNKTLSSAEVSLLYNSGSGTEDNSDAYVTLNSPANASIQYTNLVTTNASANITNGAYLVNATLYDNSTGTWGARNTTTFSVTITSDKVNLTDIFTTSSTETNSRGQNITLSNAVGGLTIVKNATTTPLYAILRWANSTYINHSAFSGNNATILTSLPASNYLIVVDSNGAGYDNKYSAGVSFPITGTGMSVTNGIYCDSNGFGANTCNQDTGYRHTIIGVYGVTYGSTSATQTFTNTYSAGSTTLWNYQFCDSDGGCGLSTSNYTFSIDSVAPTISLNYPTALINYGAVNGSLQLNFTTSDSNLDDVWYNYNGTNVSVTPVNGTPTLANITLNSKKNVTIYANDTAGNLNATTFSWDYYVFENSRSFTTPIVETTLDTFTINVTANTSLTSVYLNWNGTEYTASGSGGVYTKQLTIPAVSATETIPVYWRFDYAGTNISSSITNQVVNKLIFQLCNATVNQTLINFTTRSAENPFPLVNSSFKSNWMLSASLGATPTTYNYEDLVIDNSSYAFCTNTNTTTFYVSAEIEYAGSGYATNFYYLNGAELIANNTQNISLYLLNDSKATTTVLRVEDTAQKPFEDYTVQIQSYDVGTGTFYTVGMATTDYKGEDVVYLNWYDTLYKFIVLDSTGTVVKTTGTTKVTGTPTIIEITTDIEFVYDKFENFVYTLYYDNTTNNFVLTYTMPSGEVDSACLRVYKEDSLNQTLICDTCETSSSATVFCNIAAYGNGRFTAVFYALGSHKLIDWIDTYIGGRFQEQVYAALGNEDASFYAFLFAGIVTVALFVNAVFGIIALLIGLIGASALGFTAIQWSEMMGVIIVGGFIIWIIKR